MLKILRYLFLISLSVATLDCYADMPDKATVKVIISAAREYKVNAQDLVRIAWTESKFKRGAIRFNDNGTIDYGMFQVNSVHWTTSCKGMGIMSFRDNARCAARILHRVQMFYARSDAKWIGRYHSKTPSLKALYFQQLADVNIKGNYVRGK